MSKKTSTYVKEGEGVAGAIGSSPDLSGKVRKTYRYVK